MTISRLGAACILNNTAEMVDGVKAKEYGEPEESFGTIATMWSTYLGYPVDKHDVACMMVLLKVARSMGGRRKLDNYVDMCGYAALAGSDLMVDEELDVREAALPFRKRPPTPADG